MASTAINNVQLNFFLQREKMKKKCACVGPCLHQQMSGKKDITMSSS